MARPALALLLKLEAGPLLEGNRKKGGNRSYSGPSDLPGAAKLCVNNNAATCCLQTRKCSIAPEPATSQQRSKTCASHSAESGFCEPV